MILDAAIGAAGPVAALTIEWKNGFASMFDAVAVSAQMIGQSLIPGSLGVLSTMVAIRLIKASIDAISTRSLLAGMGEIINAVMMGGIIAGLFAYYGDMVSFVWRLVDDLVNKFSLGAAGTGQAFYTSVTEQVLQVLKLSWKMVFAQKAESSGSAFDFALSLLGQVLSPAFMVHLLLGLLITILVGVYGVIVLLQLYTGVIQIGVGTAFFPPAVSFYPIIDSWGKNAVGVIASGIAHLCICAWLVTIANTGALYMLNEIQTGSFVFFNLQGNDSAFAGAGESISKSLAMLVFAIYLLVMGLGTGSAVSYATRIFGSPSSMIGRIGHSSGSRGQAGGNAGSAGSSIGGGGGGGGVAGGAAGGAATAGAAVAAGIPTGGAGTAAVGGASAAGSAGAAAGGAAVGGGAAGGASAGGAAGGAAGSAGSAGGSAGGSATAGSSSGQAAGGAPAGSGSGASGGSAGSAQSTPSRMQAAGTRALKAAASVPYRMAVAHARNIVQS